MSLNWKTKRTSKWGFWKRKRMKGPLKVRLKIVLAELVK